MRIQAVAAVAALLLAACGAPGGSSTPGPGDEMVDGNWLLTAGRAPAGAVPIIEGHPITLTIGGTEVGGTAACNHYGGRLKLRGGRVSLEDVSMTAMGCEPEVVASEAAYLAALSGISDIRRDGDGLLLRGPGIELRFDRVADAPTAELIDTRWVLETVVIGDVAGSVAGQRATLQLGSDGSLRGSTGCRSFDGEWIEEGNQIVATRLTMTDEACPPHLADQDTHVVTVVGDGFVPTIEQDLLTLTDPGGSALVYRAGE